MLVTIRLFARLREIAGRRSSRELPDGATARTAWEPCGRFRRWPLTTVASRAR